MRRGGRRSKNEKSVVLVVGIICDIFLVNFIILCVRPARKSFGKRCLFSKERLNFTAEGVGCVIGFGDRKESSKTGIYH